MKKYMKPELQVREIRVSENIAAKINLWEKSVWSKYNMLQTQGSINTPLNLNEVEEG